MMKNKIFDPFEEIIKAFQKGDMIVMTDDEDRENEGDLVCAAEKTTPEVINFMVTYARGLVCVPMEESRLSHLGLSHMKESCSPESHYTAFMDSVDVREGTTTGISASDRSKTVQALINDENKSGDFFTPGHMFPLKAVSGGVLERPGHTEGAVDLARICGLKPAGVICEILREDGEMMRIDELRKFADNHGLKMTSITEVENYLQCQ